MLLNISIKCSFYLKGEKVFFVSTHQVIAWNKTAEIVEKYVRKGQEIALEGKLSSRSYEDKEGIKRYLTEVIAKEVLLLGSKS